MSIKLSIFALLIFPSLLFAQGNSIIRGIVKNNEGERLDAVEVVATNLQKPVGTITNKKGEYELTIPSNTNLTILFRFSGYESVQREVFLKEGEHLIIDCEMVISSKLLPEVKIESNRVGSSGGGYHLPIKKIESVPGPVGGVEFILKTLPGVSSRNEMSSQFSVRGGNFDENIVYINGIEVYRPFLVRTGQQEGLSIVNPDMVSEVNFYTGGFGVKYGDRMSSVLDISYKRPSHFSGKFSASLLGSNIYIEDQIGAKFWYNVGLRVHSNRYILTSLDKQGSYRPLYTDLQTFFGYDLSSRFRLSFLGLFSRNSFQLRPESQETVFGNAFQQKKLKIYFEGGQYDLYRTSLAAITASFFPDEETKYDVSISAFRSTENETFDILSEYWLYEVEGDQKEEQSLKQLGVGGFFEHARNHLLIDVWNVEVKSMKAALLGNWNWGLKYQKEQIEDRLNEWKRIDSAGFSIPVVLDHPGEEVSPSSPTLQNVIKAENQIETNRFFGFLQRSWLLFNKREDAFSLVAGIRSQYWDFNQEFLFSPRLSFTYEPNNNKNVLYRLATGVYSQSPFYRELRDPQGNINPNILAQKSFQVIGGMEYKLRMWGRDFKLTSEIYYKYIKDLIPYRIDNLRIVYEAHNRARGYATGLDVRMNGAFVEGIDSWISMSLLKTQEDIEGDEYGFLPRPTDQRFMLNVFFQDYIPSFPWWKMHLLFSYGSGIPFSKPSQVDYSVVRRLPPYMRVDWGTSFQLKREGTKDNNNKLKKQIQSFLLTFELFNLFDNRNVVSYIWVSDYENKQFAVPNFLTGRQVNVKLTIDF